MKDLPVSALISRNNEALGIFSPSPTIDPRVKAVIPSTMDINTFKRVARVYLTGKDFSNVELEDTVKNISNVEYGIDQLEKKYGITADDTLSSALSKTTKNAPAVPVAAPAAKPAEVLTEAQVVEKIRIYGVTFGQVRIDDYTTREIKKDGE